MQTPWDTPPHETEPPAPQERGPALQDVRIRFGVTLSSPARANLFAKQFREAFRRSGSTIIGDTAWMVFRCGALDGHEAALQAAAAVRTIGGHRFVREQPRAAQLYDFAVLGPVPRHDYRRVAREREEVLRKAMAWGLLHDPLVESAAAAQLVGRLALPDRRASDRVPAVGERAVGHRAA